MVITTKLHRSVSNICSNSTQVPTPYLYKAYITLKNKQGAAEVIPQKVGFRNVEIKSAQLLVNGQPVLVKGADRHEMDPDGDTVAEHHL